MYANIFLIGNISSRTNIAAKFGPGPNMAAIFGPTGQNMDATFGPRADIIWHGRTEYGSHILSGRTKYGSHIWSRTKFGCHNRSAGQFLGRTFCAVTGPLPETEDGCKYVMVAMDCFTRWVEVYAIRNQEATTVAKKLVDEMFCRFSPPEQLHSDQGRQFESDLVKEICELLQIRKTRTTPYHPQCNGMVERFNRTLLDMLSTAVGNNQADWQQHIRKLCLAYNSSVHSSTGFTPFFLMFGRQAKLPIDLMYGTNQMEPNTTSEYARCLKDALQEAYALVRERCQTEHKRQKELYDQKVHGKPFSPGELVWLHSTAVPRGRSRKLHHPWKGPFKVMERLGETTYKIKNLQGRRKTTFVHFDRLKPCVISDDKPENTGSREQEPVGTNLDLVDSDDDDPVQQEEAAVPEIANPPVPPLNEQRRYPVRDRQRTQRYGIYVEH